MKQLSLLQLIETEEAHNTELNVTALDQIREQFKTVPKGKFRVAVALDDIAHLKAFLAGQQFDAKFIDKLDKDKNILIASPSDKHFIEEVKKWSARGNYIVVFDAKWGSMPKKSDMNKILSKENYIGTLLGDKTRASQYFSVFNFAQYPKKVLLQTAKEQEQAEREELAQQQQAEPVQTPTGISRDTPLQTAQHPAATAAAPAPEEPAHPVETLIDELHDLIEKGNIKDDDMQDLIRKHLKQEPELFKDQKLLAQTLTTLKRSSIAFQRLITAMTSNGLNPWYKDGQ